MDLTKLSNEDLQALQAGDLSKVSTAGLQALHQQAVHDSIAARIANDPITQGALHPEEGANTFRAGIGQGMTNTARGVGQILGKALPDSWDNAIGLPTQADIDQAKKTDAPLLRTAGGKWGSATGGVAAALPVALIPGVNGYAGAAAVGGTLGLAQPVASDDGDFARLKNGAIGAAAGPAGVLVARGAGGLWSAGKAALQPFTKAGQEEIAGRTLARFADDPNLIGGATSKPTITGALPTLAEQTGDVGIARLQDSLASLDPQINNALARRAADNNAARVSALESIAGDSTKRAAAVQARDAAAGPLYQQATKANYTVDDTLQGLLKRPAVQQALERAKTLAANDGRKFSFDVEAPNAYSGLGVPTQQSKQITGQGLQDLKMAMDEMLSDPSSGFTGKAGDAVRNLRGQLVSWMEDANPAFKAARTTYAQASQPVNAMDVGAVLARKGLSNTSDLAGNPRMQANALLGQLRDEPALIEKAIGKKGLTSLNQVLSPDELNLVGAIAKESDRSAAVASAGAGPGSATAQRLASQNIVNNLIGPLGSKADTISSNVATQTILGKPIQWVYDKVAEPKIQEALARAVLDPDNARQVLAAAQKANVSLPPYLRARLAQQAAGITAGVAARASAAP